MSNDLRSPRRGPTPRFAVLSDVRVSRAFLYPARYSFIMPSGTVITDLKDALAVIVAILESARHEVDFIVPPSIFSIAGASYGTMPRAKQFIQSGGVMKGITTVSRVNVEETRMRVTMGEDLRHSDLHDEFFMIIGDRKQSLSAINIGVYDFTLATPITALWSEDPTYSEFLLASFETAWSQAVPAEQQIEELLKAESGRR